MQTSPWVILGSTVILLIVVIAQTVQNTHREKRYMTKILSAKGVALIRAVEAGTRTGMMGMRWGGQQIQRLLEETGRLPDVLYMALVDQDGRVVAHSDPSKIDQVFRSSGQLIHLGPKTQENWELVNLDDGRRVFEVHRRFQPLMAGRGPAGSHMQSMMRRRGYEPPSEPDWFPPQSSQHLLIVAGLDVTPFEQAIGQDIRTSVILSAMLLLLGFGGFVSLFWMNSYRSAKRSLRDTSAFADEVVAHLPIGLIATDHEGRITFFNAAAQKITGLPKALAIGRDSEAVLPGRLCGIKEALDRGEAITEQEMECRFADGRSVPLSISATRIVNEIGAFVGLILILRDLREVRRLEEQVRRQEKLAAIGGLAAGVAHEIRNPLSSIKGLATFFASQFRDGTEARQAAGVMIQEVDRLNRAISELLDFARPSDIKIEPVDISRLLNRSIQLIQQDAASRRIEISVDVAPDICAARVDPDRLTQCLLNIYLNAIEAMPDGGSLNVQCTVQDRRIIHIAISDTGSGIAADQLNHIFDPYFTTKNKGTGLGLAIVHKIVEAHHGRIHVHSTPGKGTTMTVQIPCDAPADHM
jgi:two-component system sensor histidine kinase HydH